MLCHSPVGDNFRIRGRMFPALISCMVVDEFHPWPRDALEDVANRFNAQMDFGDPEILQKVSEDMAEVHLSIDAANAQFLAAERRHNYTTAKSFLELIAFYLGLLKDRQGACETKIERLEKGLTIMEQVQERVQGLKDDLAVKMIQVEEKKASTDVLIAEVTVASEKAAEEEAAANVMESAFLTAHSPLFMKIAYAATSVCSVVVSYLASPPFSWLSSVRGVQALGAP